MPTFISTIKFTPSGVSKIKDTVKRSEDFKSAASKLGVTVTNVYWTLGPNDGVVVMEAPDEETATSLMLHVVSQGNVVTQTCRAYDAQEMSAILGKLP